MKNYQRMLLMFCSCWLPKCNSMHRKLYNYNLEPKEFAKLAERLRGLRGKFVLSLNDVPEVRALFRDFSMRKIDLHYTAQKVAGRRYKEVIITNY